MCVWDVNIKGDVHGCCCCALPGTLYALQDAEPSGVGWKKRMSGECLEKFFRSAMCLVLVHSTCSSYLKWKPTKEFFGREGDKLRVLHVHLVFK